MKLFSLFLGTAAAASGFNCPTNSAQRNVDVAALTMQDCACDTGYHAAPFPAHKCLDNTASFDCAANNAALKTGVATARSMADCKCNNGYVAYENRCTYAYVFHVHGRAYLTTDDASVLETEFKNDESKFQKAMAKSLGTTTTADDVLPYRLVVSNDISTMIATATMDNSRIMLGHGHSDGTANSGEEAQLAVNSGLVVSFAVKEQGDSMTDGNTLVDELKSKSVLDNINADLNAEYDANIASSDVFVWALTAQFWHPPASVAVCNTEHRGVKQTTTSGSGNTVEQTHIDGKGDKESCQQCVQDWQCQPTECFSNGVAVDFDQTKLTNGDMVCKTQPTCSPANDGSGHFCHTPYMWAKKYAAAAKKAAAAAAAPTTPAAVQKWKRAKIELPFVFVGIAPAHMNYQKRAGILGKFATLVNVDLQDVFYIRINPIDRAHDRAVYDDHTGDERFGGDISTELQPGDDGYSPAHHSRDATDVIFGVYTYSHTEATSVVTLAKAADFNGNLLTQVQTEVAAVTAITSGASVVVPYVISTPTIMPTSAPSHANVMPGSDGSCTEGTVMEIRGTARVQSLYNLEAPVNRAMTFMDDSSKGLRKCFAEHSQADVTTAQKGHAAYTAAEWCNMVVLNWNVKKIAIFENADAAHQHEDATGNAKVTFSKYAYVYTFAYVLAVPGQNMHIGNEVFNTMKTDEFVSKINYCTTGRTDSGAALKPSPIFEGTTLENYDEDMFSQPMVESMNLTSIELTYVARTETPAPTMPPTFADIDCQLSIWSDWSACSKTCGGGKKRKWRIIESPAVGNGAVCGSVGFETKEEEDCSAETCPTDCVYGPYGDWSACSVSCGDGDRTRRRSLTPPTVDGKACPADAKTDANGLYQEDTMVCKNKACPIDCQESGWSSNNACSKTCGGGKMTLYRRIEVAPAYGGKPCGALMQTQDCNQQACPTNCEVSKWSAWGSCSKTCAGKPAGTRLFGARQERTRYVTQNPNGDGVQCPALTQQRLCALHPCGAHVCTTDHGFPLTCTYENGVVYTHHVNDVHDNELFMCYHNYVTEVCTCLCWAKSSLGTFTDGTAHGESGIARVARTAYDENKVAQTRSAASDVSLFTANSAN